MCLIVRVKVYVKNIKHKQHTHLDATVYTCAHVRMMADIIRMPSAGISIQYAAMYTYVDPGVAASTRCHSL